MPLEVSFVDKENFVERPTVPVNKKVSAEDLNALKSAINSNYRRLMFDWDLDIIDNQNLVAGQFMHYDGGIWQIDTAYNVGNPKAFDESKATKKVSFEGWPLTGSAALTGDVSMSYGLDKRVKFGVAGFANVLFQIGQQDSSTEDVFRIVDIDGTPLMQVGSDGDVLRFHISPASGRTGLRVDPSGVHALSQIGAESGVKTTFTMYDHNETGGTATEDFDLFGAHEDAGMMLKISAVGVENDGSEIYTREKTVIILKDGSANPTIKATLIDTEFDEDDATADADVSMNGSDVRLTVVTPTGKTYRWTVFAEYTFNPRI